jgi:hypothetical protein
MAVRRAAIGALVAAAAALIAVFGFFYFRDNFFTHYPVKVISARIFRAGLIPWWNFYDGGGQPLAGNPNTLSFYPDNFLYLILPAHVAFNLHFLIHLVIAWFAMRALCRQTGASDAAATFAATMYAMSGLAISATVFYNLITAIALIPFALWAVERNASPLIMGAAFGLIGLAGEPVVVLSTAICVLIIGWRRIGRIALAGLIAILIVSPQIFAYLDIAREVERVRGFSATTTLNTSLSLKRVAEIVIGPVLGFLTDPTPPEYRGRLFSTIFLGIIVIPALVLGRRWRYLAIAGVMLFLALGRNNPIVRVAIESAPSLRIARYPEKFSIALTIALVVLVAAFFDRLSARWRTAWGVITLFPLAICIIRGAPVDFFSFYRVGPMPPLARICGTKTIDWGSHPARQEYRDAVHTLPPVFGAVAGVRYATDRSPEGMHSLMSRVVAERAAGTPADVRLRYLRICGCAVDGALPMAWMVPFAIGVRNVNEEVELIESGRFDEHLAALAPSPFANLTSPPNARVTSYSESLQDIAISVSTPAPALLFVNQSFFTAWVAKSGDRELTTLPLDIDRLGIIVPAGNYAITLRFGRHRTMVAIGWVLSSLLLLAAAIVLRIEKLDRSASEIERPADENVAVA